VLRHRAAWLAEVALIVAFDVSYEWLRSIRSAAPAVATERARSVLAIERWLHVAVEQSINEFTTAHTWLASAAGYYYGALHFVVTPAALIWLWRRRQESYATWRTVLALATVGALVTYLVFPVAPPRLALPGFTDTLIASNVFGAADPHGVSGLINLYAAMPSLHVGWAFWVALAVFNSSSGRFRWLAWLYPVLTTLVVMATANHFLLDGAAGSAYVASAYALVRVNRVRSVRRHAQCSRGAGYLNPPQAELVRMSSMNARISDCGSGSRRRAPLPPAESPALPRPSDLCLEGFDLRVLLSRSSQPATRVVLGLKDPTPHRVRPRLSWPSWQDGSGPLPQCASVRWATSWRIRSAVRGRW
jgi:hypothetical protein